MCKMLLAPTSICNRLTYEFSIKPKFDREYAEWSARYKEQRTHELGLDQPISEIMTELRDHHATFKDLHDNPHLNQVSDLFTYRLV